MKTYTLITFSLFFNGLIIAQKFTSLNFGKIPSQDLSLTECPFEKGAEAMVLDETCEIYIAFIQGVPTYYYEVHKRIKIFNQAGFDQGQVNLDYINKIENISNINAQVIQTDGTITKLKDDNIFTEKITEKKYRKKIAFPNLQSGSIIEYKYKLKSEKIYVLREWYFQKSIPTRNSQVIIKPEESLTYTPLIQQSLRVYQQDGFYLAQNLESIRKVPYFDRPQDHA
ncbi:MAG TPA: DUF3857 domain-containing protein [Saprospiraceae bacterium]|nr:DUF3857 domain-containing protein [Saprospiraceae bacterium]